MAGVRSDSRTCGSSGRVESMSAIKIKEQSSCSGSVGAPAQSKQRSRGARCAYVERTRTRGKSASPAMGLPIRARASLKGNSLMRKMAS
jgi:hypothetical protein